LFATSNFILSVLLARWLTPQEYGAFGLAFAIFLFVGSMQQATLIEPMLVFGSGRYKERLPEYLGALVYGHLGFSVLGSIALLLAGLGFALWGSRVLSSALLALALTAPFILLLWLMRRACYVRLEPHLAASGGAWYMALMLAGAFALYWVGWLSTTTALGVMGISSLVVSIWLMVCLRVERPPLHKGTLARDALEHHWKYGRWSVANKALAWVPHNIFYILLPIWGGLAAGASFKALMNLLMPVLQANAALAVLLLPVFVGAREGSAFGTQVRLALIPFVLSSALYWALLGIFHDPIVALAYGGRYAENANLLWLLGLVPFVAAVKEVVSQSLRALERPDWLFFAFMLSAVATVPVGVWCVYRWGLFGAGVGLVLSHGIAAVLVVALLVVLQRRPSDIVMLASSKQESR
jgi:O-antigen/teichoic acid export membrane protein